MASSNSRDQSRGPGRGGHPRRHVRPPVHGPAARRLPAVLRARRRRPTSGTSTAANTPFDLMCAYGPNLFGYANPQIDAAFVRQLDSDTLTGPTALMVEPLAETFVAMVSHAVDWAMFCKNGTDATTMAPIAARAHTRRKTVVRAKGYHHGAAPWCVPRPAGTPESAFWEVHQILCDYNDVASLEAAVAQAGDDLARVPRRALQARRLHRPGAGAGLRLCVAPANCATRPATLPIVSTTCAPACASLMTAPGRRSACSRISPPGASASPTATGRLPCRARQGPARRPPRSSSPALSGTRPPGMAAALAHSARVHNTDYLERITTLGERLRSGFYERASAAGFPPRQTGPVTMPPSLFDDDPTCGRAFASPARCWTAGSTFTPPPLAQHVLCAAMTDADIEDALNASRARLRRASANPRPCSRCRSWRS